MLTADRKRLKWRGQKNAAVNVTLEIDIVGDHRTCHQVEDFVDFTGGSNQADLLQAVDCVFFGRLFPHTLGDDGSCIRGGSALIVDRLRESIRIWVNSSFLFSPFRSYPQSRVCALKWTVLVSPVFRFDSSMYT